MSLVYIVCFAIIAVCVVMIAYYLGVMHGIHSTRTRGVTLTEFDKMTRAR